MVTIAPIVPELAGPDKRQTHACDQGGAQSPPRDHAPAAPWGAGLQSRRHGTSQTRRLRDTDLEQVDRLGQLAHARALTEVEVAVSWLAARWAPSTADLAELDEIYPRTAKVALF